MRHGNVSCEDSKPGAKDFPQKVLRGRTQTKVFDEKLLVEGETPLSRKQKTDFRQFFVYNYQYVIHKKR
jgi:hypothetical protein